MEFTMEFEEFREKIANRICDALTDEPEQEYTSEMHYVEKLQNGSYNGILIRPAGGNVGVNLNADAMYERYKKSGNFDEVADFAIDTARTGFSELPEVNTDDLLNYDVMKEKLAIQILPTEKNAEMLKNIPHRDIEDMSIVCRFVLPAEAIFPMTEIGLKTILVNNNMLKSFGITEEQLFEDAAKYAPELRPSEIMSIADVLAQMMGIDVSELNDQMGVPANPDIPMYVASTRDRTNGAGIIAYPGFMEMASEKLGGDFFLLPSSVHEVILVPDKGDGNYRDLENMVREVNSTQVDPVDQLSDKVYHYDSKDKIFELAEKFDARAITQTRE